MIRTILLSFAILLAHNSPGQQLLLNGGFEEENICTEFRVSCAPEAWISSTDGFSNYFKDANRAFRGLRCMAIEAGHSTKPYQRSFIRSPLVCGLRKGNSYFLSFYVKSPHPVLDSIGVYFGPTDPLLERKPVHLLAPTFFIGEKLEFRKDSSWQRVVIEYVAKGNEAFLNFANYSRNDVMGPTGIDKENHFFVFLDEINLEPADPNETICPNWETRKEEIYSMNARHRILDQLIKYQRNDTALKLPLLPGGIRKVDTLLLPDVFFASDKKDLQPASYSLLDSFCRTLGTRQIDSLLVEGHADNTGDERKNEILSRERADAVADYLRRCSYLSRVKVIRRGWGSGKPVAPNDTPENKQKNRRVALLLYIRE